MHVDDYFLVITYEAIDKLNRFINFVAGFGIAIFLQNGLSRANMGFKRNIYFCARKINDFSVSNFSNAENPAFFNLASVFSGESG